MDRTDASLGWLAVCCFSSFVAGCSGSGEHTTSASGNSNGGASPSVEALTSTATVTLVASGDTSIRAGAPNQNFGSDTDLDVNRALVQFSTPALRAAVGPTDRVVSASLNVTLINNALRKKAAARTVGAFRLTSPWTELGATWNCAVDSNTGNKKADCSGASQWSMDEGAPDPWVTPATATITIVPTQIGAVSFSVTADVAKFLSGTANDGWMLRGSTAGEFAMFAARETTTPPQLVLTIQRCSAALCDDGNACTVDSCDATANCVHVAAVNGTTCNDGNACTHADSCQAGTCTGSNPVTCTALDQCHSAGTCNPSSGMCSNPAVANGTACNDGNACTRSDSCQTGVCAGANPVTCIASDQCHAAGTCDPASGTCSNPAAANGTACNDGNVCTQLDTCASGACVGQNPVACTVSDQCHAAGACDPSTGMCSNPALPDGSACSDGNACTSSDTCRAGACAAGAPVVCASSDGCHPGVCDPSNGACSNPQQCTLYGVGSIPKTATDGLVVTPPTLEDGLSNNLVGGLGSAISYTGVGNLYLTTPDRGPNNGLDSYTDRYYEIEISLAGGVVTPRIVGADTFKREGDGAVFTGLGSAFDATNSPVGSLRLDPEGVRVTPSGTMFVSDEYGPFLYEFGNDGTRLRSLSIPSKFLIANPRDANGSELPPTNTSGRQTNRGMEGLALIPDGSKLYGLMQSPLIQDGALSGSSRIGTNNRMLEITLSNGATRELLYQMDKPSYGLNELLAINDHQFLSIERDGSGGGAAAFKRLFMVDISAATDISGIASLPSTGTPSGVTPVSKTPFLDLLAPEYGLAGASFPEKIEGITFGPDLPDGRHTLIVTNDNDFITDSTGHDSNFYVFAIGTPALPGFVAAQASFSSSCDGVACVAAGPCYLPGTCNPSTGTCPNPTTASGTPTGTQTPGDCQLVQCDGAGNVVSAADDTDVPVDGNQCTNDVCTSGAPSNPSASAGTACSQGGIECDGTGVCVDCLSATECPGTDTECAVRACMSGACGFEYAPSGIGTSDQIAGDCDRLQCDGTGHEVSVVDDTDVPDDGNPCTADLCALGAPSHANVAAGLACGPSQVCDGSGVCVGCLSAGDCPGTDTECAARACTMSACGFSYAAAGLPTSQQIPQDCLRNACDGTGNITTFVDDSDLPADDGNSCTADLCSNGAPVHPGVAAGTSCGGSNVCDGSGACVACVTAANCPGTDGQCGTRTCTNHVCGLSPTAPHGASCTDNGGQTCDGAGSCVTSFRVVRVGTGSAVTAGAASPTFVDEYTLAGSLVGTVALPTAVAGSNRMLTLTGDGTGGGVGEGGLSRSGDEHYLVLAGYDAAPGTAAVSGTASSTTNRIAARIDASGSVDTSTRFSAGFSANNVRGATTSDGSGIWASGAGSATKGVWYLAFGGSGGTQLNSATTGGIAMNWVNVVSGQLYGSSAKGPNILSIGSGLPTSGSQAESTLPGYPSAPLSSGPWGFALLDLNASVAGLDTLYVADDTGGIKKWTFNGTTWSNSGSSFTLGGSPNYRGLAAMATGSTVTVIAGTSDANGSNRIVEFVDNGASSVPGSVIVTAGTNQFFRGMALSPHL